MKVLIADDHALFRRGLRLVLAEADRALEAIEAANFDEVFARAEEVDSLDVVLLDLAMPGMEPFDGLCALCQRLPDVPVVVLSASESRETVERALRCGARGYVLKSSPPQVLLHVLPLVLAGETYIPAVFLSDEDGPRPSAAAEPTSLGGLAKLSRRERDVLEGVIAGRSNKQIAQDLAIDEGTVKVHLKAVLRKLQVANRTQAAMLAVRSGWRSAGGGPG